MWRAILVIVQYTGNDLENPDNYMLLDRKIVFQREKGPNFMVLIGAVLFEKIGMRPGSDENDSAPILLFEINQKPIRADMAFAKSFVFAL